MRLAPSASSCRVTAPISVSATTKRAAEESQADGTAVRPEKLRLEGTDYRPQAGEQTRSGTIEDVVYLGLGVVLAGSVGVLLVNLGISLLSHLVRGTLASHVVALLDQVLLVLMIVEILYTVQVSFREHVLVPEPFILVALIAGVRRILILTAELSDLVDKGERPFRNAMFELGLLTKTDSRFRSAADLLAYAKANPGKLNIGSINVGSTQNLAAELLKIRANVDFQVVPFNGSPAVLTALRGGQIDAAVEILSPVMAQVTSKALRVLAVTGEKRSTALPDVPTVMESGIAGYAVTSWNSLAAPARTPAPVIARLNREVNTALADPEVVKKLRELHVSPGAGTPEQARELLTSEITRWGDVMTRAGIAKQ